MSPSELRKWIVFGGLSVVLSIGAIVALLGPGLRYGLDRSIDALPADIEDRLGFAALDSSIAVGALDDPALVAATTRLAEILDEVWPGRPVRVYVLPDSTLNAFATPGGGIFVHTALLARLDGQDELFAVLGHELSHVRRRHGLKSVVRAAGLAVGAGVLLGDAGSLVGIGAQVSTELLQRGYGRRSEEEADADAVRTLDKLGMPRSAMVQLLTALETGRSDHPPEFLSTHPTPETRRANIAELGATLGDAPPARRAAALSDAQWAAIRSVAVSRPSPTP